MVKAGTNIRWPVIWPVYQTLAFGLAVCLALTPAHAERLGFEAEHLLEAPMNARYLALPVIANEIEDGVWRLHTGFNHVAASVAATDTLLLGADYTFLAGGRHYLLTLFADLSRYSGGGGRTQFDPLFISQAPYALPADIQVKQTSGQAQHLGVGVGRIDVLSPKTAWQYGVLFEYYRVAKMQTDFDALTPAGAVPSSVDYAHDYIALTPYASLRRKLYASASGYRLSGRIVGAWPLPRQGFYGRFESGGFSASGNTGDNGYGKHIPDPYLGLDLLLSDPGDNWRISLGASVYYWLTEGLIHEGISSPVFFNISWKL